MSVHNLDGKEIEGKVVDCSSGCSLVTWGNFSQDLLNQNLRGGAFIVFESFLR